MRGVWAKTVNDNRSTIVKGTFDNTGAEDGWADLIIIAQVISARAESGRRIFTPRTYGRHSIGALKLCLHGTLDGTGWVARLHDRIEIHEEGTPQFRLGLWRQTFSTPEYISLFHPQEEKEWGYHLLASEKIVMGRAQSQSYIAVLPPDEKAKIVEDVKGILEQGDDRMIEYSDCIVISRKK